MIISKNIRTAWDKILAEHEVQAIRNEAGSPLLVPAEYGRLRILNSSFIAKAEMLGDLELRPELPELVVGGYASPQVIDKEKHLITKEAMRRDLPRFLAHPHYRNANIVHTNIQVGEVLPEWTDPETGEVYKTQVDDIGLFSVVRVRTDKFRPAIVDKVIADIQSGKLTAFSISGDAPYESRQYQCADGTCFWVINKIEYYEITLCEQGVNQDAKYAILSKMAHCEDGSCPLYLPSSTVTSSVIRKALSGTNVPKPIKSPEIPGASSSDWRTGNMQGGNEEADVNGPVAKAEEDDHTRTARFLQDNGVAYIEGDIPGRTAKLELRNGKVNLVLGTKRQGRKLDLHPGHQDQSVHDPTKHGPNKDKIERNDPPSYMYSVDPGSQERDDKRNANQRGYPCAICGRPMSTTGKDYKYGGYINTKTWKWTDDPDDSNSEWYPVGSDCHRRFVVKDKKKDDSSQTAKSYSADQLNEAVTQALRHVSAPVQAQQGTMRKHPGSHDQSVHDPRQRRAYHATSLENMKAIMEEGLRHDIGKANFSSSEKGKVYIASDPVEAADYGYMSQRPGQPGHFAVLEIELSEDQIGSLEMDVHSNNPGETDPLTFTLSESISPEAIRGHVILPGRWDMVDDGSKTLREHWEKKIKQVFGSTISQSGRKVYVPASLDVAAVWRRGSSGGGEDKRSEGEYKEGPMSDPNTGQTQQDIGASRGGQSSGGFVSDPVYDDQNVGQCAHGCPTGRYATVEDFKLSKAEVNEHGHTEEDEHYYLNKAADIGQVVVCVALNKFGEPVAGIRKDRKHGEAYEFPAGHVQQGESLAAAAERELFEESGVKGRAVRKLGDKVGENGAPVTVVQCVVVGGEPVDSNELDSVAFVNPTDSVGWAFDDSDALLQVARSYGLTKKSKLSLHPDHTTGTDQSVHGNRERAEHVENKLKEALAWGDDTWERVATKFNEDFPEHTYTMWSGFTRASNNPDEWIDVDYKGALGDGRIRVKSNSNGSWEVEASRDGGSVSRKGSRDSALNAAIRFEDAFYLLEHSETGDVHDEKSVNELIATYVSAPQLVDSSDVRQAWVSSAGKELKQKNLKTLYDNVYSKNGEYDSYEDWYNNGELTVYRGVGTQAWHDDNYDPSDLEVESWTLSSNEAERFATGGGSSYRSQDRKPGKIYQLDVPVKDVLGYWVRGGKWGSEDEVFMPGGSTEDAELWWDEEEDGETNKASTLSRGPQTFGEDVPPVSRDQSEPQGRSEETGEFQAKAVGCPLCAVGALYQKAINTPAWVTSAPEHLRLMSRFTLESLRNGFANIDHQDGSWFALASDGAPEGIIRKGFAVSLNELTSMVGKHALDMGSKDLWAESFALRKKLDKFHPVGEHETYQALEGLVNRLRTVDETSTDIAKASDVLLGLMTDYQIRQEVKGYEDGWTPEHQHTWGKPYNQVAELMSKGAGGWHGNAQRTVQHATQALSRIDLPALPEHAQTALSAVVEDLQLLESELGVSGEMEKELISTEAGKNELEIVETVAKETLPNVEDADEKLESVGYREEK